MYFKLKHRLTLFKLIFWGKLEPKIRFTNFNFQPFICIHPVIIWSQDSNSNSTFLLLVILIWFLPVVIHVLVSIMSGLKLLRLYRLESL